MKYSLFLALPALAMLGGCGKLADKFGRLDEGYTRVYFEGDRSPHAALSGGMMIYFASPAANGGGKAFGFPTAEAVNDKSVIVPNGSYHVYALGIEGGAPLSGQAKCGYGNGGAPVNLSGGATTIFITINTASCAFGTDTPFSTAAGADGSSDFDNLTFGLCSGPAVGCSPASGSYRLKYRLAGGQSFGNGGFIPSDADSLTSGCSNAIASGTITSSFKAFIGNAHFSPPVELQIYSDSTCTSGARVGTVTLYDGLHHYLNVASSSTVAVDSPASAGVTYLKFKFP